MSHTVLQITLHTLAYFVCFEHALDSKCAHKQAIPEHLQALLTEKKNQRHL